VEKVIAVMLGVLSLYFLSILHFFILFLVFFELGKGRVRHGREGKEGKGCDFGYASKISCLVLMDEISSKMWWLRGTLFFVTTAILEYLKFVE
jgi:hypothetical protein